MQHFLTLALLCMLACFTLSCSALDELGTETSTENIPTANISSLVLTLPTETRWTEGTKTTISSVGGLEFQYALYFTLPTSNSTQAWTDEIISNNSTVLTSVGSGQYRSRENTNPYIDLFAFLTDRELFFLKEISYD